MALNVYNFALLNPDYHYDKYTGCSFMPFCASETDYIFTGNSKLTTQVSSLSNDYRTFFNPNI
ncbi:hypothetical protein [Pseudodesulfovibrio sp.]|uniref:hypothetical protein n=1 Tax=unclassified Pseudodesulfovibrio TaxID=2661612 RepID=UPI003AFFB840